MIELKGQYLLSDFEATQKLHAQRGRLATWAGYYLIGLIALLVVGGGILALLGRFPWSLLIFPVIELSDEAFELRNEFGSSRIPWKNFVKWKQNKALLLLYRSDFVFQMLPGRIF